MEKLALAILGFVTVLGAFVFRGWVLWLMWYWFLVPIGAPDITIALALGIATLVAMPFAGISNQISNLTKIVDKGEHDASEAFFTSLGTAYVNTAVYLFAAWVISFFV